MATRAKKDTETAEAEAAVAAKTGLTPAAIEDAATEAKRSFSLRDRLQGFKGSKKTHLLFFDLDAADRASALQGEAERARMTLDSTRDRFISEGKADDEGTAFDEADQRLLEAFKQGVDAKQAAFDEAYAEATQTALQFTMRYIPEVEVKHIEKEAKKAVGLAYNDKVTDDLAEEYGEQHTFISLSRCVVEIKDAEGNIADAMTVEDAQALYESAPSSVWRTLLVSVNTLIYSNQFAKLATDNSGF